MAHTRCMTQPQNSPLFTEDTLANYFTERIRILRDDVTGRPPDDMLSMGEEEFINELTEKHSIQCPDLDHEGITRGSATETHTQMMQFGELIHRPQTQMGVALLKGLVDLRD